MQKKFSIINFSLIAAVLFSMLFQSVHSIEHIAHEFAEKKCQHKYDSGKTQITHQHHNFDHCFACDFTFSNFISAELFSCQIWNSYSAIPYFAASAEAELPFSVSSCLLRGPPVFIV